MNTTNQDEKKHLIEKIAHLSSFMDILVFDKVCTSWKLKPQTEINKIIDNTVTELHNSLCSQLKSLNRSKQYNKAVDVLKYHHLLLDISTEIVNLTAKYYLLTLQNKLNVIEYFSTEFS